MSQFEVSQLVLLVLETVLCKVGFGMGFFRDWDFLFWVFMPGIYAKSPGSGIFYLRDFFSRDILTKSQVWFWALNFRVFFFLFNKIINVPNELIQWTACNSKNYDFLLIILLLLRLGHSAEQRHNGAEEEPAAAGDWAGPGRHPPTQRKTRTSQHQKNTWVTVRKIKIDFFGIKRIDNSGGPLIL